MAQANRISMSSCKPIAIETDQVHIKDLLLKKSIQAATKSAQLGVARKTIVKLATIES